MARVHFWQYLRNEEGQPVEGGTIGIYLAGTSTAAYIYTQESGGTASNTVPQLTTDADGFFEFWIADSTDTHGYSGQKFKITWEKAGVINSGYVDYVEMVLSPVEVDETDTDTTKNKMVSNNLARSWSAKAGVYTETVEAASWTENAGNWFAEITHSLENEYPVVFVYDDDDDLSIQIYCQKINASTVRVWRTDQKKSYVTVVG
jgi:hypothetical protein